VIELYKSQVRSDQSEGRRSKYYDLDPVPIANTGPFRTYGKNGQGPHPVHWATTSHDNPGPDDKDSTNFGVDSQNGWKCLGTRRRRKRATVDCGAGRDQRLRERSRRDVGSGGCASGLFGGP